jgi:hypothetical protein
MRTSRIWFLAACLTPAVVLSAAANAADAMRTKTVGPYRVEIHVLPAERFFSKEDVAAKHVKEGMEIESGAAPVMLDAASHPNHHLIVHVFEPSGCPGVRRAFIALNAVKSSAILAHWKARFVSGFDS